MLLAARGAEQRDEQALERRSRHERGERGVRSHGEPGHELLWERDRSDRLLDRRSRGQRSHGALETHAHSGHPRCGVTGRVRGERARSANEEKWRERAHAHGTYIVVSRIGGCKSSGLRVSE